MKLVLPSRSPVQMVPDRCLITPPVELIVTAAVGLTHLPDTAALVGLAGAGELLAGTAVVGAWVVLLLLPQPAAKVKAMANTARRFEAFNVVPQPGPIRPAAPSFKTRFTKGRRSKSPPGESMIVVQELRVHIRFTSGTHGELLRQRR